MRSESAHNPLLPDWLARGLADGGWHRSGVLGLSPARAEMAVMRCDAMLVDGMFDAPLSRWW